MLIVASCVLVLADGFKNGRTVFEESYSGYQGPRQHPPYHEQHRPFREQSFSQSIRSYRQPTSYRDQSFFHDYSNFKNRPTYHETHFLTSPQPTPSLPSSTSYEISSSYVPNRASFGNEHAFQTEYFKNRSPTNYHNHHHHNQHHHQSTRNYFPNEFRHSPNWITSYRSEPYQKTVDTYEELEKETRQRLPFDEPSNYLKYGNHGLGFASVPEGFDENTLPLDTETSTMLSTTLTATHNPLAEDTVSNTTQTIPQLHSLSTAEPKIAAKAVTTISTTPTKSNVELNTLANAQSNTTNILLPTMPSMLATPKQYSQKAHILMSLTTVSNSSSTVTESPAASYDENSVMGKNKFGSTISPSMMFMTTSNFPNGLFNNARDPSNELSKNNIQQNLLDLSTTLKNNNQDNDYFPLSGLKSDSYQDLLNLSATQQGGFQNTLLNLQNSWKNTLEKSALNIQNVNPKSVISNSLLNYLISKDQKNNVNGATLNYVLPTESRLTLKDNSQSKFPDYLISDDSKQLFKNNLQNMYLDYLLQGEAKRGLSYQPLQQSSSFNYFPTTIQREQKLTLPINGLPSISQSLENVNYVPNTIPYLNLDSSPRLTLGSNHQESLSGSLQGTLSASIPNSIPGSIPAGISAAMPASISTGIPTNIPTTIEFAQTFQQPTQIRPIQESVTPYSGMQLQLGGFGGIDYGLRSSSPEARPMELGIAKVGLSVREFPRPHNPTFGKIGFGQPLW
ncbi:hypothetical protein M0802_004346 [Mischocyttarus mexicanus]|nr:hypothetical protein M0802_004346 [Mischocyttarus mexicanus]